MVMNAFNIEQRLLSAQKRHYGIKRPHNPIRPLKGIRAFHNLIFGLYPNAIFLYLCFCVLFIFLQFPSSCACFG